MTLIKTDQPHTAGIVTAMRQYAAVKQDRDKLILEGLAAGMAVWRIAEEMSIDRKTVFKVRDQNREET
jgi:DNA-binding NarL/FixJ family response regulator